MFLVHPSALSAVAPELLLQFSQSASKVWRKSETLAADLKCFHAEFPHGFIFATFMLASMLGSSLASRLLARIDLKVESYMQLVFLVAAGSLCFPVLITVSSSEFPASLGVYVAWSKLLQIPSFSDLYVDILLAGLLNSYSQVFGIL
jgi:hypothetical protein